MILQEELIDVGAVESRVRPSVPKPRLDIYSLAGETRSHSQNHRHVRPVSRRSIVQDQRRMAHVHIGRIHLLGDWVMAELLDDCGEVIVVLPMNEAHHAVASRPRH